ncbi:RluA family pseudouridine synthase [Eubacteriales bacterium OttesenSCG-928-N13]|nr:RluA family pseudouridine synthase [Eubacteriales bacterium OttesenSCG-928-N13]
MDVFSAGSYRIGVLYLDNHLLVVRKPPNMPVQADRSGDLDLLTACKGYIGERFSKPGAVYLGLVHRLDRPVGGVMVLARTSKAAARLSAQFAGHDMDKRYLCVLNGVLDGQRTLRDWLLKDEKTGSSSVVSENTSGAKLALLDSCPIAVKHDLTLSEVQLHTGRSHQIRVQHAHIALPLWGDQRYGTGRAGEQLALWAWKLTIEHPTRHEQMTFLSRPPRDGVWGHFQEEIDGQETHHG